MAIVAGAATDVLSRQCGICGDKIEEDEPAYNLMEELDDGVGGRSYRHAGNAQEPMSLNSQKRDPSSRPENLKAANEVPAWPNAVNDHSLKGYHDALSQDRLVFDQVEGKLTQAEPIDSEGTINLNSPDGFDGNACIDLNTREFFALEQSPFEPGMDEFSCFTDDMAAGIDPVGPIDDTQIEGA